MPWVLTTPALLVLLANKLVHGKTFLPVPTEKMPMSEISGWEKCDKVADPSSPACSCPCNSELVTVTQYYPGHGECLDPTLQNTAHNDNIPASTTSIGSESDNYVCPRNFDSIGSSGTSCVEDSLLEFVPIASTSFSARTIASSVKSDPYVLMRCDCFSRCMEHSGCHHVIFVSGSEAPKCQLYGDKCTTSTAETNANANAQQQQQQQQQHASGLHATLFRKIIEGDQAVLQSSVSSCKKLGWALTSLVTPQTTCSAAGVCTIEQHGSILPGGRCRRRCSGDVTLDVAETFCSRLGARLCTTTEVLNMNIGSKNALSCGGDFHVLNDAPIWTTGKCTAKNHIEKKMNAKCLPNPSYTGTITQESNEIPFGAAATLFACVDKCARKFKASSGVHQACRFVRYDGIQCWMVTTSSMNSCLSFEGQETDNTAAEYLFDSDPSYHSSQLYEVFSEGQLVASVDAVSNQFRTTCRSTSYISDTVSNTAYALCCADRWPKTLPLFQSKGEQVVSSSITEGTVKGNTLLTQGVTGIWSSDVQTRFKLTTPISTKPIPTWSIEFLDGVATMMPATIDNKDLSITTQNRDVVSCTGPNGGQTAIDTAVGGGFILNHGGDNGFSVGTSWTIDVFIQGPYDTQGGRHTLARGADDGDHHIVFDSVQHDQKFGIIDSKQDPPYDFQSFNTPGITANELIGDDQWKRVTMVTTPGKTQLYVDGVFKGEAPYASAGNIYFIGTAGNGGNGDPDNEGFGKISQFRYFDHSLTAAQIAKFENCQDTKNWNNLHDGTCSLYAAQRCTNGEPNADAAIWFSEFYNYPENNCCACGKKADSVLRLTFPELENPQTLRTGKLLLVHGPFDQIDPES